MSTANGGIRVTLAIDLDVFNVGSTPLQMLLVVLILTVIVGLIIMLVTQVLSPYLNRRWPPTAPLSPTELLWGEAGGHVKRTFQGLDLEEQKDLASQLNERKVPAGAAITSQGEPATAFYMLKTGSAEVVQVGADGNERKLRDYTEGDSFGEVAILERSPRTATVRALTDCVVLELPAEDFVAASAQTAAQGNDFLVVAQRYLLEDKAKDRIAAGQPAMNPVQQ
ncbi:MAG TPA: cyclic nucleotide-binding domain-containing protein, partial [Acidimicrobiales bacterium]|nr:cyclic nucleotide-binding domain-containing protein [Acidimicrobiales bacterium]